MATTHDTRKAAPFFIAKPHMNAPHKGPKSSLEEPQADLDLWIQHYNQERPHSGKYCFGKTPWQTFLDSISLAKEKMLGSTLQTVA